MFCPKCGKELPDGTKFCSGCGTPVAPPEPEEQPIIPPAPAPVPAPAPAPAVPSAPAQTPAPAPVTTQAPPAGEPQQPKGKKNLAVIGIAAVAVIAVVVAAVMFLPGMLGGGGSGGAVFAYRNDDNELMFLADLSEKTQPVELTDEADYDTNVRFSPDGKTVYFTEADHTLYAAVAAELEKGGRPERISRDVASFTVLADGRVLYRQYDADDGDKLSIYDGTENYRLLRDYNNYQVSDGGKTIYYTEYDEDDGTYDLYKMDIAKDAKGEKILKGASSIYTRYDEETLVYGVEDGGDSSSDGNTLTVYSCAPGGDKTKLISDVYSVHGISVDGGKVSFYYTLNDLQAHTLYDFVTDTQASADAATLAEPEPVYPDYDLYWVYDLYYDNTSTSYYLGSVWYTDYYGNTYDLDLTQIIDASVLNDPSLTLYEITSYYYSEIYDLAYADADAREAAAYADYETRYDGWYAAQQREYMRQELKEYTYDQSSFSLYRFTGEGEGEQIATQVIMDTDGFAPYDGIFLYQKAGETGGTVADLSELSYAEEIYEKLESGSATDGDWYQNVGGKESVLEDLEDADYIYNIFVLNGEVVIEYSEGSEQILAAYAVGENGLTLVTTICEDDDWNGPYLSADGTALYVFTEADEESNGTVADFCIYRNGKLETIAREVYGAVLLTESGTTYLVTDIDSRDRLELSVLSGEKNTVISDEVDSSYRALSFLDASQVLYLADNDLYLWDGAASRRVATDVMEFWVSQGTPYVMYSAA